MDQILTKSELFRYTGDVAQIFYAKPYIMMGGRAEGLKAVDLNNGAGLEFTVIVDRCMDIGRFSYKGVNFAHLSKVGYVSPYYYDGKGLGGMKSFTAGFLTTCGLDNVGSPCEIDGQHYGVHGSIGNTPAEEFYIDTDLSEVGPCITVKGKMRQASFLGTHLWLSRSIRMKYGENKIWISDVIENRSFERQPLMLLYHFNMGYPLLDYCARFDTSFQFDRPRDPMTDLDVTNRFEFSEPIAGYQEQVFYYQTPELATQGKAHASLFNQDLQLGVVIRWDPEELPRLSHWKNPKAGDYVMGIEPSNCLVEGLKSQRDKYRLEMLEPMQKKTVSLEIELY